MKKTLIVTTASWLAQNGLSKIGKSVDFCLRGTTLFLTKDQEKKLEVITDQLSSKGATVHQHSEITKSESAAYKTIYDEFFNWRRGGLLIITNDHLIAPVTEKLKKEFGNNMLILDSAAETTDANETGEAKDELAEVPVENQQIPTAPEGKGRMQQWAS